MTTHPHFAMPKAVKITARSSSITNSFVNGLIPVIAPTHAQVDEALQILGMGENTWCSYCGDRPTEWDHLRPLVVGRKPTGYISEIHNLVPSCGKCNQSKGNKPWRTWMYGTAKLSPHTRGVENIDELAQRLDRYEAWQAPTQVDFELIVGADTWAEHWARCEAILTLMREAQKSADQMRAEIAAAHEQSRLDLD